MGIACGETSTFHSTYSKLPVRPLVAIPRLAFADKRSIVGNAHDFWKGRIAQEVAQYGHALFWQDLFTPRTLSTVFRYINIGYLFDLGPGSGTVALAVTINEIGYEGIVANEKNT